MKKQQTITNTFNKSSIVIAIIALAAVAVAGYSYYGGVNNKGRNLSGTCSMMGNSSNTSGRRGCGMMGTKTPNTVQTQNTSTPQQSNPQGETLFMTYTEEGLTPKVVNLQKGKKYTIIINAMTTLYGCMNAITLPGLDDNLQPVQEGTKIAFNIDAQQAGTYDFVCGMGLSHGAQVVIQ